MLKNRLTDFKYFVWLIRNRTYWKSNKYSLIPFIKYWILYSIPRLVLGREKTRDTSRNIISRFQDKNLIIPLPMNLPNLYFRAKRGIKIPRSEATSGSYWIGLRDSVDFSVFREVCIEDHYNFSRIKSGMTVLDIGAHIGTFTLLASKKVGKRGKVVAVEPEIHNFEQLKKNLELNKIKNVIGANIALSDFNGEKDFFITKCSTCHSFSHTSEQEIVDKIKVKSLDSLMKELNIEKVDLLKIDAENAELEILKGAHDTLMKNPQIKMVIAAYHSPQQALEITKYLKELNFSPKILPGIYTLVVVE